MDSFRSDTPTNLRDNEISTPLASNINLSSSSNTILPPKRKASKDPSTVWEHFTKIDGCSLSDPKAGCNYCHKTYACHPKKHGTSSMLHHVGVCKKNPDRNRPKDQQATHKFDPEDVRMAIAEMIICDEVPFKVVEGQGFRKVCQSLEPRFQVPSRTTVARDCIKLFKKEKEKLRKVFKEIGRVSLTTDTWTSNQNFNYMCLTAHFIDCEWKLHKKIINFCLIPNHKGDTIGRHVESCLQDWGIEKIFTVTVDNASSNDVAIDYLKRFVEGHLLEGKYIHIRCCAHIMNLIVNDGLKDCDDSIARVRNAVKYVRSSPARMEKFKKCIEKEKISCLKLVCLDVPTRWNSTYLMLEVAETFQKPFLRLENEDGYFSRYCRSVGLSPPSSSDWVRVKIMVKFLKIFYDATVRLSGSLYVTSNAYFQEICGIQSHLSKMSQSNDPVLKVMATSMKSKYNKYWGSIEKTNLMIFIAVVLDPRCKFSLLHFWFKKIYGGNLVEEMIVKVKELMIDMYGEYSIMYGSSGGVSYSEPPSSVDPSMIDSDSQQSFWVEYEQEIIESSLRNKSEIDQYLEHGCEARVPNFDILDWWKINEIKYPILARVARDVMAIPVSTISSESAFSAGGRVLDPFRCSLSPRTVEALVCTQNWLKDPITIDLRASLDNVESFEAESEFDPQSSFIYIDDE
ncbi:zinc finger BED domain-containing protein RICESLEEPER 2-like isoform X2 [Carya illinoinensis]|nr:zinc finger BED domain-containing protein RICESLEEPER 2-like isoform X2 [Carya illinoinensis]